MTFIRLCSSAVKTLGYVREKVHPWEASIFGHLCNSAGFLTYRDSHYVKFFLGLGRLDTSNTFPNLEGIKSLAFMHEVTRAFGQEEHSMRTQLLVTQVPKQKRNVV